MVVVSPAYPPSSSGAFLTLEQQETHQHHTFHLSSLLKALVHFQESLCPRVQQQLKAQVGLGNLYYFDYISQDIVLDFVSLNIVSVDFSWFLRLYHIRVMLFPNLPDSQLIAQPTPYLLKKCCIYDFSSYRPAPSGRFFFCMLFAHTKNTLVEVY